MPHFMPHLPPPPLLCSSPPQVPVDLSVFFNSGLLRDAFIGCVSGAGFKGRFKPELTPSQVRGAGDAGERGRRGVRRAACVRVSRAEQ